MYNVYTTSIFCFPNLIKRDFVLIQGGIQVNEQNVFISIKKVLSSFK